MTTQTPLVNTPAARRIRLNTGEHILRDDLLSPFWTWGLYCVTLGLWEVWRRYHRMVLTNQRLMIVKGIVFKSERSVNLGRIQDVNLERSFLTGGYVTVSSAGGPLGIERFGPFTQAKARDFADAISEAIPRGGDGVSSNGSHNGASAAEELQRLSTLRDSGVLTEQEFTEQKARLLKRA